MSTVTKPKLPVGVTLGMIVLMWSASVYSAFGVSAFPRQEWLLELLVSVLMFIPVINLLAVPGSFNFAVKMIGVALLAHSVWDALHWPAFSMIDTPIDPRIPYYCPLFDIPFGLWMLVRRN